MARTLTTTKHKAAEDTESIPHAFFRGFFWPVRMLGRLLAWLSHRPPLKQIGHALRWFFRLKPLRFLAKVFGFTYIYRSWKELKYVTWPSLRESLRLTSAVIIFSVIFGAIIAVVDYGLDKLFKQVLLK